MPHALCHASRLWRALSFPPHSGSVPALLVGVGGAALCLRVASILSWPHCLFPTSVLSCVLVSVQHGLNLCPLLAPGPQGFCLESQEGVTGQCWVSPWQHGQSCLLAACLDFWMVEGIPGGACLPSASGLGAGWNRRAFPASSCRAVPGSRTLPFLFAVTIGVGCSPHHCQASCREGAGGLADFD